MFSDSARASENRVTLKAMDGRVLHQFQGSTQSLLMERFSKGMKARMPEAKNRDKPLVAEIVAPLLDRIEAELFVPGTESARVRELTMTGAYIAVTFGYSLRGNEGFWVDGPRLMEGLSLGANAIKEPHVVVSLMGSRFKGEDGDRMHLISLANVSRLGIRYRVWLERVVRILKEEGKQEGPAFCDEEGYMLSSGAIETVFQPFLSEMQEEERFRQWLPQGLDVEDNYKCSRSSRRGSEVSALNQDLKETTINFVHRWSKVERAKGKVPGFNMLEHYAEGVKMRPTQIRFSACL